MKRRRSSRISVAASPAEPSGGSADLASRRAMLQVHLHPRTAARAGIVEVHRAGADDVRSLMTADRADRHFVGLDLLRVPLDDLAAGSAGPPARQGVGDALDRFEVVHELRQVLEVPPEAVEALRSAS